LENVVKTFATIPDGYQPSKKTSIETTLTAYYANYAFIIATIYDNRGIERAALKRQRTVISHTLFFLYRKIGNFIFT
jgi:hypothetical protein